jgi:hypothetical protein
MWVVQPKLNELPAWASQRALDRQSPKSSRLQVRVLRRPGPRRGLSARRRRREHVEIFIAERVYRVRRTELLPG